MFNRLISVLNRIASALEQLVPALQQATREARRVDKRHCDLCLHVRATEDPTFEYYGTDGNI